MLAIRIILALMILGAIAAVIYAIFLEKRDASSNEEDDKFINIIIDKVSNEKLEKENAKELDEALNNPEYISKEEKERQANRSQEFMNYLKSQNAQTSKSNNTNEELAQTKEEEINKAESLVNQLQDITNVEVVESETTTNVIESKEKEDTTVVEKPKRKYTKRKSTAVKVEETVAENEAKDN